MRRGFAGATCPRVALAAALLGCATAPVVTATPLDTPTRVNAEAPREALVSALARGDTEAVWQLLGDGPRASFESREAFTRWCRRHAADWLVLLSQPHAAPEVEWHFGSVVVQAAGDELWGVVRSPALPAQRSYVGVLAQLRRLAETLSAQSVLHPTLQHRWLTLAGALEVLIQQPAPPPGPRVTLSTPAGTHVSLAESAGEWTVLGVGVDEGPTTAP